MDLIWEIPETQSARTLTITGTAETSDGSTIAGSFNVTQNAPQTFDVTIDEVREVSVNGGPVTMEYLTSAPSVELSLTSVPDFITDFTYTQPVNGVGTFTIVYKDNYLNTGRQSTPCLNAYYDGFLMGRIWINDYQSGTSFWMSNTEQTISYVEQVVEVIIHNESCDLKKSNLSLRSNNLGATIKSYTPATPTSNGILYLRVPVNAGPTRQCIIEIDALNDNGEVIMTATGLTIIQLEIPPVIYVDLNVDAGFNRVEVEHSLYGDWWVLSKVNWIQTETPDGVGPSSVTLRIGGNASNGTRIGYVYIYGEVQTYIIKVIQSSIDFSFDPDGIAIPICEEITYSQNVDKMEYTLYEDGTIRLYSGKAYKYPDSDTLDVTLNDVISNHLTNNISFKEGAQEMDGFMKLFTVGSSVTSGYKTMEIYDA